MLQGTFAFTAGNARGTARAVRLTNGKMPEGVVPFECKGLTAADILAAAEAVEQATPIIEEPAALAEPETP